MPIPRFVLSAAFASYVCSACPSAAAAPDASARVVLASWYGPGFHGRPTASGCRYDQTALTAASRDLPLGAVVEVSRGARVVRVVINDRGPYVGRRRIDLSRAAAARLDMLAVGVAPVRLRVLGLEALRCRHRASSAPPMRARRASGE